MKFNNLLRYAVRILSAYGGEIPLNSFLKNFFRENPQMGSRDRKQVSEMCYCFFRLGHTLKNISAEERILSGIFLSNHHQEQILEQLRPEWHARVENPLDEKLEMITAKFPDFQLTDIFPWKNLISADIDHRAFCLSFLEKPRLFIRVRPGQEQALTAKLIEHKIKYCDADPGSVLPFKTYSFIGGTKLDNVYLPNREAVVQDLSSQRTARFLKPDTKREFEAWDCCAGSGGKSILLADLYPGCRLTVSDIRESILKNLSVRFREAGIEPAKLFTADLTDQNDIPRQSFNFIVADLPCTGSGTWSRTPEALYYFRPEVISNYRQRQEKILSNIVKHLKPDGILVYITCSVFADENEQISARLLESGNMKLDKQEILGGYDRQSDTLYAARFTKTS
ncbi:MAG TPA: methyltransferase domain-containing protein [Puia sp.]